jgi:transposase InsO family protein
VITVTGANQGRVSMAALSCDKLGHQFWMLYRLHVYHRRAGERAHAYFASVGIVVERVLTDNGSCYRSRLWRDLLYGQGIKHKRTRPYRPQTNGKVERFHRTLADEWAYARPYTSEAQKREAFAGHTITTGSTPRSAALPPPAFLTSQVSTTSAAHSQV